MPVYKLTCKGGSPRLFEMTLPEIELDGQLGVEIPWDPPEKTEKLPEGAGPVELYRDDFLIAEGLWPDLVPAG